MKLRIVRLVEKVNLDEQILEALKSKKCDFIAATVEQFKTLWNTQLKQKWEAVENDVPFPTDLQRVYYKIADKIEKNLLNKELWWHETGDELFPNTKAQEKEDLEIQKAINDSIERLHDFTQAVTLPKNFLLDEGFPWSIKMLDEWGKYKELARKARIGIDGSIQSR